MRKKQIGFLLTGFVLFALMFGPPLLMPSLYGEETPKAEGKAESKDEAKKEEKSEGEEEVIGKKVDADLVKEIVTNAVEASKQKGSFWRNPALWEVIMAIIAAIVGFFAAKYKWTKQKWGKIIKSAEVAINTVYREFIREAKARNEDGKLTADEIKEALGKAWELTKEDLKKQGIELAKYVSQEYFPVLVDKVLKAFKKN